MPCRYVAVVSMAQTGICCLLGRRAGLLPLVLVAMECELVVFLARIAPTLVPVATALARASLMRVRAIVFPKLLDVMVEALG